MEETTESYSCPRCGYTTAYRPNMKKHLERKRPCQALVADIPIETITREYPHLLNKLSEESKQYACEWCSARFTSRQGLCRHRGHFCQKKPSVTPEEALRSEVTELRQQLTAFQYHPRLILHDAISRRDVLELMYSDEDEYSDEDYNSYDSDNIRESDILRIIKRQKHKETYQHLLKIHRFPGATHRKLACGISDITTDTVHAEIKHYSGWKEAIGQLTAYNAVLPRPELHVYFFGKYAPACKKMVAQVLSTTSIQPFEMRITDHAFIVEHLNTGEQQTYPLSLSALPADPAGSGEIAQAPQRLDNQSTHHPLKISDLVL